MKTFFIKFSHEINRDIAKIKININENIKEEKNVNELETRLYETNIKLRKISSKFCCFEYFCYVGIIFNYTFVNKNLKITNSNVNEIESLMIESLKYFDDWKKEVDKNTEIEQQLIDQRHELESATNKNAKRKKANLEDAFISKCNIKSPCCISSYSPK